MCGINGITRRDRALVERMNRATAHRGPDGTGIYEHNQVTLGHNRLAIIDTSPRGTQPMRNPDGSLVITYNGELYNFRELRGELQGYPFQSDTDTEVILAAYQRWGVDCLSRFNGMFAFALWDDHKDTLILARDHAGIKPLYYSVRDKVLLFSSEIKALMEAGLSRTLAPETFPFLMHISEIPEPHTPFEGIFKLPPAHYATFTNGKLTHTRYWEPETSAASRSSSAWQEEIRSALDAAVARQLVSDRPVGVLLSGGIDSNAVVASASKVKDRIRTYTVRFDVENAADEARFNRDAQLAKQSAAFFGTDHTEVTLSHSDIQPFFEKALWHMDEPTGSATALAQFAIARSVSKHVAVVLGGDGGDELFGGYERYRLYRLMEIYRYVPAGGKIAALHPALTKLNVPPGIERFTRFHFQKREDLDRLFAVPGRGRQVEAFFKDRFFSGSDALSLETLMDVDRRMLSDGSLLRTDKLFMASGVEARVPLLDKELIELATHIPASQKVGLFTTKVLFKQALQSRLPAFLFQERKRGWFAPAGAWLRNPQFHAYAKEVLTPSYYEPTKSLCRWDEVQTMLEAHRSGVGEHRAILWSLLAFQVWARRFSVILPETQLL